MRSPVTLSLLLIDVKLVAPLDLTFADELPDAMLYDLVEILAVFGINRFFFSATKV